VLKVHIACSFCDRTIYYLPHKGLCAVKGAEEYDEKHVDLTQQCGKPPCCNARSSHRIHLIWKHPRHRIDVMLISHSEVVTVFSPAAR